MNVSIVYNDDSTLNRLGDYAKSPNFYLIDERYYKGKKEGFKLKGHWGARLSPFAICYDDQEKPLKAFYNADKDVVTSLIQYLTDEGFDIG